MTEPTSGSDTPEADLVDKGVVACHARKVDGGYRVNGAKLFISNGHFSTWHMTVAFEDLKRPSETGVFLAVKTGTEGFQIAGKETKMGQLACPASELFFNDCFVPDAQVALSPEHTRGFAKTHRQIYQRLFDDLCSISRAGICALSAGRGPGRLRGCPEFCRQHPKRRGLSDQRRMGAMPSGRSCIRMPSLPGCSTWKPIMPTAYTAFTSRFNANRSITP